MKGRGPRKKKLFQLDEGKYIGGKRFVLGLREDSHTGNLGIEKLVVDGDDARDTSRLYRKGSIGPLDDDGWSEDEDKQLRLSQLKEIETLKGRIRNYDLTKQTPEGKAALESRLSDALETYQELWGERTEEEKQRRAAGERNYNARRFGFDDLNVGMQEYKRAVFAAAQLSRVQKDVWRVATASSRTQGKMATKLGRTQQAVSKALEGALTKLAEAKASLGGPHNTILSQLRHWADIQGRTTWGRMIRETTGEPPTRCSLCSVVIQIAGPTATSSTRPAERPLQKRACGRCKAEVGELRDACPYCGCDDLIKTRRRR
jgi:hypothetical protein